MVQHEFRRESEVAVKKTSKKNEMAGSVSGKIGSQEQVDLLIHRLQH